MVCDFRVECGRCDTPGERETCSDVWWTFASLYLAAFVSIVLQLIFAIEKKSLFFRVLGLWGIACLLRFVGGTILATHTDKYVHPIILELLWHSVWLFGCFALTHFTMIILNCWYEIKRLKIGGGIPVRAFIWTSNGFWGAAFVLLSVVDGLSSSWPNAAVQWFVWMACAIYLDISISYVVSRLYKKIRKLAPKQRRKSRCASNLRRASKTPKTLGGHVTKIKEISVNLPNNKPYRDPTLTLPLELQLQSKTQNGNPDSDRSSDIKKLSVRNTPGKNEVGAAEQKKTGTENNYLVSPTAMTMEGRASIVSEISADTKTELARQSVIGRASAVYDTTGRNSVYENINASTSKRGTMERKTIARSAAKATTSKESKGSGVSMAWILKMFTIAIVSGLTMYSVFLFSLGVTYAVFPSSVTLIGETIITCFHQTGMLFMGIGMQAVVLSNAFENRFYTSKSSKGSKPSPTGKDIATTHV